MNPGDASVILTGAAGGIGAAAARHLLAAGASVLLVGRSAQPLLRLATELSGGMLRRDRLDALVADITTAAGRAAICETARARNANVLINNAGVPGFGRFDTLSSDTLEELIATNLLAPMLLTSGLLPHLSKQSAALILNIGSTAGSIGVPGFSAYGASKAGLLRFSEALRRELADSPIKVQYLAPRAVATDFNDARATAFNAATGASTDSADTVAIAILEAIRNERPECFLGLFERFAARLNGLCPRLLDGAFARHRRALAERQQALIP